MKSKVSNGEWEEQKISMREVYEKYIALPIDKRLLCLERGEVTIPYFCYPADVEPIGFEGCIMYCFLPEYGEMVFACNPESCADRNIYPLAANFEDFVRLILAVRLIPVIKSSAGVCFENQCFQGFENPCNFKRKISKKDVKKILTRAK